MIDLQEMAQRVYANSIPDEDGCLIWDGAKNHAGYGLINIDGNKITHRITYKADVGPIPEGLELDHNCEKRACVRTACLEPVTHAENLRRSRERGRYPRKTAVGDVCSGGHVIEGQNAMTYVQPKNRAIQYVKCRTCHNAKRRARSAGKVAA